VEGGNGSATGKVIVWMGGGIGNVASSAINGTHKALNTPVRQSSLPTGPGIPASTTLQSSCTCNGEARNCLVTHWHRLLDSPKCFSFPVSDQSSVIQVQIQPKTLQSCSTDQRTWDLPCHKSCGSTGPNGRRSVPERPCLFKLSASLASAITLVVHAAAATVVDASGSVTHMCTTVGWAGKNLSRSLHWGSRREHSESCGGFCSGHEVVQKAAAVVIPAPPLGLLQLLL